MNTKRAPSGTALYGPSLRAIRTALGVTRNRLAADAGISASYLYRIENTRDLIVSGPVALGLAHALGVEVEAITRPVLGADTDDGWPA
jgi:transcriptional regulator with XRE-family HTH domain